MKNAVLDCHLILSKQSVVLGGLLLTVCACTQPQSFRRLDENQAQMSISEIAPVSPDQGSGPNVSDLPPSGSGTGTGTGGGSGTGTGRGSATGGGVDLDPVDGEEEPPMPSIKCELGMMVRIDFKCHASASSHDRPVHCGFHFDIENLVAPLSQDEKAAMRKGTVSVWYSPASLDEALGKPGLCSKSEAGSLLASLEELPLLKGGQYQIRGHIEACAAQVRWLDRTLGHHQCKSAMKDEMAKYFLDVLSKANGVNLKDFHVRKGNELFDLSKRSNPREAHAAYCIGKRHHQDDDDQGAELDYERSEREGHESPDAD